MKELLTAADPADPEVRVEWGMARAETARRAAAIAAAEQFAAIAEILAEAREHPEIFLGQALHHVPTDAADFAERSAVADLAIRLQLSESVVRNQGAQAMVLRTRTPRVWQAFRDGEIPLANAGVVAEVVLTLPEAPGLSEAFDAAVVDGARRMTTPRLRERVRVIRERLHPETLAERNGRAREQRRVWLEADRDGMCWLSALLPAESGQRAMARLDAVALSLAAAPAETRTLAQLRADIAADLLTGDGTDGGSAAAAHAAGAGAVGVTVAVTVPVLSLLGVSDAPATLEGYGPIDAETARRLTARAPSFQRILTHPVTGTVLDIDRSSYRVPADLKRWAELRDQRCQFAGCGRRARDCDLDHVTAWADGGVTGIGNLAHLCRHHHRLKHESRWSSQRAPDGAIHWTSPTGEVHLGNPPPF